MAVVHTPLQPFGVEATGTSGGGWSTPRPPKNSGLAGRGGHGQDERRAGGRETW